MKSEQIFTWYSSPFQFQFQLMMPSNHFIQCYDIIVFVNEFASAVESYIIFKSLQRTHNKQSPCAYLLNAVAFVVLSVVCCVLLWIARANVNWKSQVLLEAENVHYIRHYTVHKEVTVFFIFMLCFLFVSFHPQYEILHNICRSGFPLYEYGLRP